MGWLGAIKGRVDRWRLARRWQQLRALGMQIGSDVNLPDSTWIDVSHCFLISIGDHCGFGPNCTILAHDAQMDEFLDAARIGQVRIRESCHIGAGSTVLAGVEIGPRTIVGAHSVVATDLPPDTVCVGNPARPVSTLEEYLEKHRQKMASAPRFPYLEYDLDALTPNRRRELQDATTNEVAYIVGGRTAELAGHPFSMPRT